MPGCYCVTSVDVDSWGARSDEAASTAPDHRELEDLFFQYRQHRFHWFFSYWLFRQPAPLDRQLRAIYLQWRPHSRRKVSSWGSALCDVRYLASLHQVTADYWRGRLACGDETAGE